MRRALLIALWFSILFLPFGGLIASLILFASIVIFMAILNLAKVLKPLISKTHHITTYITQTPHYIRYILPVPILLFPFYMKDYYIDVAILTGIYIILSLGLNVVVGFCGLLNLGFVAFYAMGAYSYAILNVKAGLGFWQSLPISLALSTASGFLLAIPALRLRGDYLAIVTLGFGEITRLILNNWDSFTGGPNGISGIQPPTLLGISLGKLNTYYYLVLLMVTITYIVIKRVKESRIGRAWMAIREDEVSASTSGINVTFYKFYAFSFGAFWAGLGGILFAAKMQFVSPESFTFMESVLILCMVILGGLGNIGGVMLGAVILVVLPEVLRGVQNYRMLAVGVGLILIMLFRPQGLFRCRK
ncbi:MAG: hypothetical protein Fur0020_08190 [Thermodesulfovibrionia bacterium]